ncbi:UDP-N-acetylglucosamine transferase subunit ALG13 homolog [Teleopsis dalmanni]|uniref:UDP-N-acetylglucosamine transferase subunit ALG13 homolog n=1 Tax=Teleopsis dalmanni TaxID=139649 RepID=UPI0018CFE0BF|nr:UDP-N-acetylglucosamine transferase subunit ALG13 homolog [Teleopsis dalmanni]XP_037956752.1 UDP-N-acetylglucosamine transferase subunit ALG13 homolog [Teleopsis dalmanni]
MVFEMKRVFITVGTTKFDELISEIISDKVLNLLQEKGCCQLTLQIGKGEILIDSRKIHEKYGINVEYYPFKFDENSTDIVNADLVIGHAGAGTCIDILTNQKPSLIVINENLMNNHQTELAIEMAAEGYLYYCNVKQIAKSLEHFDFNALAKFELSDNVNKFVDCLNKFIQ